MNENLKCVLFGFKSPETESLFRLDYFDKLIPQIRIGFVISIFIYLVFYFIDSWVFPDIEPKLLLNRIIASSLFACILLLSYTGFFKYYLQWFLLLFGIIATIGILWKLNLLNITGYDFSFFYPGLILTSAIVSFYLRIRFLHAALLNVFSIAAYVVVFVLYIHNNPVYHEISLTQTFVNSLFFIVCSSFLSLYGSYYLEKITRNDFLNRTEIKHINTNLEKLVKERSFELEAEKIKSNNALIEGQEKERERISKELHDNINNQLSLLKMELEGQMQQNDYSGISRTISGILKINEDVREIAHNHSTFTLRKLGPEKAIRDIVDGVAEKTGIQFNLHFIGTEEQIEDNVSLTFFRVFQEALSNIVKHAKTSNVEIQLIRFDHTLSLSITDNGIGFNMLNCENGGIGLNNMKLRVEQQLNGELIIDSKVGAGTTIIATVNM